MDSATRPSGIPVLGNISWGSHFCMFYRTRAEQLALLVAWFKAGLENREACVWMVAGSLTCTEAEAALRVAVPDLDGALARGQMLILGSDSSYREGDGFNVKGVFRFWTDQITRTAAEGYEGLRVSGDSSWVKREEWPELQAYEAQSDAIIASSNVLVLCTYAADNYDARQTLEAMGNHAFSLLRRDGAWEVVDSAARPHACPACAPPGL